MLLVRVLSEDFIVSMNLKRNRHMDWFVKKTMKRSKDNVELGGNVATVDGELTVLGICWLDSNYTPSVIQQDLIFDQIVS